MGKRELAQIIAAQEWHDPTKWVSKKNKREEEVNADEKKRMRNVLGSVKKVRKSTEIRKKKTTAKQKTKTKNEKEESPSKSSKSTRDTTIVSVRSKSVTPASEEEKKDLEDDDPRTFDLLGNVGAATGKKGGTLTSAEEKRAKRKDIDEEEKEEEKDAVIKEPETTLTTSVKVKEEEGSPPPPFPLHASAKKAPIVEKEKGENGVSHSCLLYTSPSPRDRG